MMYRNDHDAALLRIEALEHENATLTREVAQLRATPAPSRQAVTQRLVPDRRRAKGRTDMTTHDWIMCGFIVMVVVLMDLCNI
jgi:hypothetical protein